jgi:hypothetical protein
MTKVRRHAHEEEKVKERERSLERSKAKNKREVEEVRRRIKLVGQIQNNYVSSAHRLE